MKRFRRFIKSLTTPAKATGITVDKEAKATFANTKKYYDGRIRYIVCYEYYNDLNECDDYNEEDFCDTFEEALAQLEETLERTTRNPKRFFILRRVEHAMTLPARIGGAR